ncbi:MerR family transcriptional regulator [Streptomyces sp. NPDC091217]|uniref:MerR family transcriptional regulator n=1 Tax=Streptomyces sp. NPDC091217 TaxID=3365975 RepID=UPI003804E7FB
MRIGELAAAVGVTTRTVRHYHHQGLLPEPERLSNGYRDYTLRHAVVLARIRRLTELGLGLAEVRDVLADDAGKDLAEVLTELDEDLARQEAELRERRQRLRALLDAGALPAEGPVSPELAGLFRATAPHFGDSPMAAKDREVFALVETVTDPAQRAQLMSLAGAMAGSPQATARANEVYTLLDALADADTGDPRVAEAARVIAGAIPAGVLPDRGLDHGDGFMRALYADLAPAQAAAIRRALDIVTTGETGEAAETGEGP